MSHPTSSTHQNSSSDCPLSQPCMANPWALPTPPAAHEEVNSPIPSSSRPVPRSIYPSLPTPAPTHERESMEYEEDDRSTIMAGPSNSPGSPGLDVLLEAPEPNLPLRTICSRQISIVSNEMISPSTAISDVIIFFRNRLDVWMNEEPHDVDVIRASKKIDELMIRTIAVLGPIWTSCVRPMVKFENDLNRLQIDVGSGEFERRLHRLVPENTYSQVCALGDTAARIEVTLSDLSKQLEELYTFVDECMSPIIARLMLADYEEPPSRNNESINSFLDAQSYLVVCFQTVLDSLNLFVKGMKSIDQSLEKFLRMIIEDSPEARFASHYGVVHWTYGSGVAVKTMMEGLGVLATVSDSLRDHSKPSADQVSHRAIEL